MKSAGFYDKKDFIAANLDYAMSLDGAASDEEIGNANTILGGFIGMSMGEDAKMTPDVLLGVDEDADIRKRLEAYQNYIRKPDLDSLKPVALREWDEDKKRFEKEAEGMFPDKEQGAADREMYVFNKLADKVDKENGWTGKVKDAAKGAIHNVGDAIKDAGDAMKGEWTDEIGLSEEDIAALPEMQQDVARGIHGFRYKDEAQARRRLESLKVREAWDPMAHGLTPSMAKHAELSDKEKREKAWLEERLSGDAFGFLEYSPDIAEKDEKEFREMARRGRAVAKKEEELNRYAIGLRMQRIRPSLLDEDSYSLMEDSIESHGLTPDDYERFKALPDHDKAMIAPILSAMKGKRKGGFLHDAGAEFINTAIDVVNSAAMAPVNAVMMHLVEPEQYQEYMANRAFLEQATYQNRGDYKYMISDWMIDAVATVPYMAAAALPKGIGLYMMGAQFADAADKAVAARGGDLYDPSYQWLKLTTAVAYAAVERLQVGGIIKPVNPITKGLYALETSARISKPAQMMFRGGRLFVKWGRDTAWESVEEGLQGGMEGAIAAYGCGEDVARAIAEQSVDDFAGSLGSMGVLSAFGKGGGVLRSSPTFTQAGLQMSAKYAETELEEFKGMNGPADVAKSGKLVEFEHKLGEVNRGYKEAGGRDGHGVQYLTSLGYTSEQAGKVSRVIDSLDQALTSDKGVVSDAEYESMSEAEREGVVSESMRQEMVKHSMAGRGMRKRFDIVTDMIAPKGSDVHITEDENGDITYEGTIKGRDGKEKKFRNTIHFVERDPITVDQLDPKSPDFDPAIAQEFEDEVNKARLKNSAITGKDFVPFHLEEFNASDRGVREAKLAEYDLSKPGKFHMENGITSEGLEVMTGRIDIEKNANLKTVLHEHLHSFVRMLRESGEITDEDIENAVKRFGEPRVRGELFNEEAAADEYMEMAGRGVFLIEHSAMEKVYLKASEMLNAGLAIMRINKMEAAYRKELQDGFFASVKNGNFNGIPSVYPGKPKAKPARNGKDQPEDKGKASQEEGKAGEEPAPDTDAEPVKTTWDAKSNDGSKTYSGSYVIQDAENLVIDPDEDMDGVTEITSPEDMEDTGALDSGMPIVDGDGNVLVGGRTAYGLRMAAANGTLGKIEEHAREQAKLMGMEIPGNIKHPVLLRARNPEMTQEEVDGLRMSARLPLSESEEVEDKAQAAARVVNASPDKKTLVKAIETDDQLRDGITAVFPDSPQIQEVTAGLVTDADRIKSRKISEGLKDALPTIMDAKEKNGASGIDVEIPWALSQVTDFMGTEEGRRGNTADFVRFQHRTGATETVPEDVNRLAREIYKRRKSKVAVGKLLKGYAKGLREGLDTHDALELEMLNEGETRYSISKIYTGSRVGYDQPSLKAIGTGEGHWVYGWGLYGSVVHGVAKSYADRYFNEDYITYDGKRIPRKISYGGETYRNTADVVGNWVEISDRIDREYAGDPDRRDVEKREFIKTAILVDENEWNGKFDSDYLTLDDFLEGVEDDAIGALINARVSKSNPDDIRRIEEAYKLVKSIRRTITEENFGSERAVPSIVEQTWWTHRAPGDESHLISWYEPLSDENMARFSKAIKDIAPNASDDEIKESLRAPKGGNTGGGVAYFKAEEFAKMSGALSADAPRLVSEALYKAGIDGVKYPADAYRKVDNRDGRRGYNYVAFSDEHLRVDHRSDWNGEEYAPRYSISKIYTGSRVGYDQPSLKAIGTGEGHWVYGWGLYGSAVPDVAEYYADRYKNDRTPKKKTATRTPNTLSYNGDRISTIIYNAESKYGVDIYEPFAVVALYKKLPSDDDGIRDIARASILKVINDSFWLYKKDFAEAKKESDEQVEAVERFYGAMSSLGPEVIDRFKKILREESDKIVESDFVGFPKPQGSDDGKSASIVEQTWWTHREPGDESHLIEWYEPLSDENKKRFSSAIKSALPTASDEDVRSVLHNESGGTEDGGKAYYKVAELLEKNRVPYNEAPRLVSEALYKAGIDGVKYPADAYRKVDNRDGRRGYNYVAFSDEHLRIDHRKDWNGREYENRYSISKVRPSSTAELQYEAVRSKYFGTDKWMKAPNGEPTRLTERQWIQVRTPNFKAWFGDWENDPENASKVVGENGEPMVMHHFTPKKFTDVIPSIRANARRAVEIKDEINEEWEKFVLGHIVVHEGEDKSRATSRILRHNLDGSIRQMHPQDIADSMLRYTRTKPYLRSYRYDVSEEEAKAEARKLVDMANEYDQAARKSFGDRHNESVLETAAEAVGGDLKERIAEGGMKALSDADWESLESASAESFDMIGPHRTDGGFLGRGAYFTESSKFSGSSILGDYRYDVFINSRSPMMVKELFGGYDIDATSFVGDDGKTYTHRDVNTTGFRSEHDAVWAEPGNSTMGDVGEIVVFSANQIKSATDNNGDFSKDNDDIRYSISKIRGVYGGDNLYTAFMIGEVLNKRYEKRDPADYETIRRVFGSNLSPDEAHDFAVRYLEEDKEGRAQKLYKKLTPAKAMTAVGSELEKSQIGKIMAEMGRGASFGAAYGSLASNTFMNQQKKAVKDARGAHLADLEAAYGVDISSIVEAASERTVAEAKRKRAEKNRKKKPEDGEGIEVVDEDEEGVVIETMDDPGSDVSIGRQEEIHSRLEALFAELKKISDPAQREELLKKYQVAEKDKDVADSILRAKMISEFGADVMADGGVLDLVATLVRDYVRVAHGGYGDKMWLDAGAIETYKLTMADVLTQLMRDLVPAKRDNDRVNITKTIDQMKSVYPSTIKTVKDGLRAKATIDRLAKKAIVQIQKASVKATKRSLVRELDKYMSGVISKKNVELDEVSKKTIDGQYVMAAKAIRRAVHTKPEDMDAKVQEINEKIAAIERAYEEKGAVGSAEDDIKLVQLNIELLALQSFGHLAYESVARISEASDFIHEYFDVGLERLLKKQEARRKQVEEEVKLLRSVINTDKAAAIDDSRLTMLGNWAVATLRSRLMAAVAGAKDDASRDRARALVDEIMFTVEEGSQKRDMLNQRYTEELYKAIESSVEGTGHDVKWFVKKLEEQIPNELSQKITRQGMYDDGTTDSRMTYNQLLNLYGYLCQTSSYGTNIEKHNRQGQKELIEAHLTPEMLRFVQRLREAYEARRAELSFAMMEVTGLPVYRPDPMYLPERMNVETSSGLSTQTFSVKNAIAPSLTPRVRNSLDVDEKVGITDLYEISSRQVANVVAFGERGVYLRDVLTDGGFLGDIKKAYGRGEAEGLRNQVTDVITDGYNADPGSDRMGTTLSYLNSMATYTSLSWNLVSASKQIAGIPSWIVAMPDGTYREMWKYILQGFDKEAARELMSADGYYARYGRMGVGRDALDAIRHDPNTGWGKKFVDIGMTPLQWVDLKASMIVGVGYYKAKVQEYSKRGFGDAEAKRRAAISTWAAIERAQQSDKLENTNEFMRRQGWIAKSVMKFASSPILQASNEIQACRIARRSGRHEDKVRRNNIIFANHVFIPLMMQAISLVNAAIMGEDRDKEWWEVMGFDADSLKELVAACVLGQYGRILFFGSLSDTAIRTALGLKTWHSSGVASYDYMFKMVRYLGNGGRDLVLGEFDDAWESFIDAFFSSTAASKYAKRGAENWGLFGLDKED